MGNRKSSERHAESDSLIKVLIVDDSDLVRVRLKNILVDNGHLEIVGEARNSSEAIQKTKELHPDIVILDIKIPGENGIEVLKKIKKYELPSKVIMLTNYPYPQYKQKCKELGAELFLQKSNDFEMLPDAIESLFRNSANAGELFYGK